MYDISSFICRALPFAFSTEPFGPLTAPISPLYACRWHPFLFFSNRTTAADRGALLQFKVDKIDNLLLDGCRFYRKALEIW